MYWPCLSWHVGNGSYMNKLNCIDYVTFSLHRRWIFLFWSQDLQRITNICLWVFGPAGTSLWGLFGTSSLTCLGPNVYRICLCVRLRVRLIVVFMWCLGPLCCVWACVCVCLFEWFKGLISEDLKAVWITTLSSSLCALAEIQYKWGHSSHYEVFVFGWCVYMAR